MLFMDLIQHQGLTEMGKQVLTMVIALSPPDDLFMKNINYTFLLMHQWEYLASLTERHPELPVNMMLLIISYGSHREYPEFSIYSLPENHNPIFIVLNQFRNNLNLTDPPQREILERQTLAAEFALDRVKEDLNESEYSVLRNKLGLWKRKYLASE